ncbi:MAG: alpha-amylase family glycosyl hydrolase [Deltaproteobacteria bacterium]
MDRTFLWWQTGIIYQIYPLSFKDSNGDGIGDIRGIISKLDYLAWLGVTALWISPLYVSPMADFGYDISDYTAINPLFGTMDDFDRLLREIHSRRMRLIMDFVPNHTSNRHPWFIESRSSADNPRRGWYIWQGPAPGGGPPNNWLSSMGGPGWELDQATGQYYYHGFLKEQPDVNWRDPGLQKAFLDVMRFWLDKGVDGFRVDVMWHLIKDDEFRDNPPNPEYREGSMLSSMRLLPAYSADRPQVLDVVALMRDVIDEYDERVLIGEVYLPVNELVDYYGEKQKGAHLPANFQLLLLPWNAMEIFAGISKYEASLPQGGWPNWVLGNHDRTRVTSRIGRNQARVAAMLLLLLRGTPTMYYGDEIGMSDVMIPRRNMLDPAEQQRDPQRTPMQWGSGRAAGFTTGKPWLPVDEESARYNVESEKRDPGSMLNFYRSLIRLRQSEPSLQTGDYWPVGVEGNILAFIREDLDHRMRFLVVLNLGHDPGTFTIPARFPVRCKVVFATDSRLIGGIAEGEIGLRGAEGMVAEIVSWKKEKK